MGNPPKNKESKENVSSKHSLGSSIQDEGTGEKPLIVIEVAIPRDS